MFKKILVAQICCIGLLLTSAPLYAEQSSECLSLDAVADAMLDPAAGTVERCKLTEIPAEVDEEGEILTPAKYECEEVNGCKRPKARACTLITKQQGDRITRTCECDDIIPAEAGSS